MGVSPPSTGSRRFRSERHKGIPICVKSTRSPGRNTRGRCTFSGANGCPTGHDRRRHRCRINAKFISVRHQSIIFAGWRQHVFHAARSWADGRFSPANQSRGLEGPQLIVMNRKYFVLFRGSRLGRLSLFPIRTTCRPPSSSRGDLLWRWQSRSVTPDEGVV